MKEHRKNNFIVVCIIFALIVLIPLTGVVADAAINSNGNAEIGNGNDSDVVIDSNIGSDLEQDDDNNSNDYTPEEVPAVQYFFGKALSLESGPSMIFYVNADALSGKENVSIEFTKPVYENGTGKFVGYDVVVETEYISTTIAENSAFRFIFDDINAKEYSVDVTATLVADGEVMSETTLSVKQYAQNQLNKNLENAKFNTLLVDMLNYGAAVQIFFGYNTDNLANADLTDAQKQYATQEMPEIVSKREYVDSQDGLVDVLGVSLSLMNTIDSNIRFDLNCNIEDVYAVIEYVGVDGSNKTMVVDGSDFEKMSGFENRYYIVFAEYGAMQISDTYTVKFYDANTDAQIGDSIVHSIESYVASVIENSTDKNLLALVDMMMRYGVSAEAYFG